MVVRIDLGVFLLAAQVDEAISGDPEDPRRQRAVIELSFFEELSHAQIAKRLSLPLGTVKSRIRLAFGTLRVELEHKS